MKTRTYLQKLILLEVIIFLFLGIWYFNRIHQIHNQVNHEKLTDITNSIENYFLTTLAVTESIMLQESRRIQSLDGFSYQNIYGVISDFQTNDLVTNLIGWDSLRWYDFRHNKIVVDSTLGVLKEPIDVDLEKRQYLKRTISNYNTLFVGEPLLGAISGKPRIPFGMGITDKNGIYIGSMLGGYSIEKFQENIKATYKYDQVISFAIFNKNGVVIIDSGDNSINASEISSFGQAIRNSRNINLVEDDIVESPFAALRLDNEIIKRIANLPLYIVVKINPENSETNYMEGVKKSFYDLIVIVLAFTSLVLFVRITLLKPLIKLSRTAQKIASDVKNIEFKKYSTHELNTLSDALKKVVEQKFALSSANEKLEFLAHKAQVASTAKSDFIRNLQHEFRTPLNHILGASEVLLAQTSSNGDKEYLNMIIESGRDLLENINKVIEIADLESGRFRLVEKEVSIPSLIESALSQVYSRINLKNIKVIQTYDKTIPEVIIDQDKITRALVCILDNCITFAKQKDAQIVIKAYTQHSRVMISVADNGLGIKENDLERITESFESSGNVLTKFHRGIGLGLTIVKSVLESHDADLSISSQEGLGTEIVVSLPKYRTIK